MSLPMFDQDAPRRRKPARVFDPWARKVTIPEWQYIMRERGRAIWIVGVGVGLLGGALLDHVNTGLGLIVLGGATLIMEGWSWRQSKR